MRFKPRREVRVRVELVTPQFGGGAEVRVVDVDQWLRPSAVRGALRFWWRARHAHDFKDVRGMHDAERAIFGSAGDSKSGGPGLISVCVECDPPLSKPGPFEPRAGDAMSGAYFPAQSFGGDAACLLPPNATATIVVRAVEEMSDADWSDAQKSLRMFLLMGGSGARTRRAAGALVVADAPSATKIDFPRTTKDMESVFRDLPSSSRTHGIFTLAAHEAVYLRMFPGAEPAHRELLETWRRLRQDREHPGGWKGSSGWGRTRWPEADAIRLLHHTHARWEDRTTHAPDAANAGKAPRAHLGLPIVVKFKDDRTTVRHRERGTLERPDPRKSEIVVDDTHDRYASPVMLSVAVLHDNPANERFAAIALVTRSELKGPVKLRGRADRLSPGDWNDVSKRVHKTFSDAGFQRIAPEHTR